MKYFFCLFMLIGMYSCSNDEGIEEETIGGGRFGGIPIAVYIDDENGNDILLQSAECALPLKDITFTFMDSLVAIPYVDPYLKAIENGIKPSELLCQQYENLQKGVDHFYCNNITVTRTYWARFMQPVYVVDKDGKARILFGYLDNGEKNSDHVEINIQGYPIQRVRLNKIENTADDYQVILNGENVPTGNKIHIKLNTKDKRN